MSETVVRLYVPINKGEIFILGSVASFDRIPHRTIQHQCRAVSEFLLQIVFICTIMTV